ncbi:MAG: alpha/beta hydrolase [Chloroflexota bacterium]
MFYTQQRGPKNKPALLLVHGAGGTHLDWPAELRRLPNTAVYTLDLPGHGRSTLPGYDTVTAYADSIADFLTSLPLNNVVVAGHSMGGAIAQELGLRHLPQLVGLILIGSGARLPVSSAILDQALHDFDAATAFVAQHEWAAHIPTAMRQLALERLRQTAPAVLHADFVACNTFDVRSKLAEINVPTLIIGGTEDKMTPLKFSQFMAEHIHDAQLITLSSAGHMMTLEQPTAVATAVQTFLANLQGNSHDGDT